MINRYVYRGTTPDWPGNPVLQAERKTCASTDPLVATLFAIECLQHGPGIVLLIPQDRVEGLIAPSNHSAMFESEIVVNLTPLELLQISQIRIEAQAARDILVGIGFEQIPIRIAGKGALREALVQSYAQSQRLSPDQIHDFNRKILGATP